MALDLQRIEKLETEWRALQPLPAELEEKLWEKLRLEWNYNSNHIEGNTLTYKETEMYLLRGQTSGVHVEREYVEMKGHDYAIEIVRNLASSPEELTEADIRNLNQVILKQSFYKDAITPDGRQARKQIVPGRYKLEPNSVRLANGELFKYADPIEVPMRMARLMQALRTSENKDGLELLATLAITHHEFALIHPFDDGNGRVARLLTNYVLLKKGFPPIVVPSARKADYLKGLEQADAGDLALLADFFAEQLIWSLELGIKAAKGESLEEPSDIEKEIALFVREQKGLKKQVIRKDVEVVNRFLTTSALLLFEKFDEKTNEIGKLFESRAITFYTNIPLLPMQGGSWRENLTSISKIHIAALSQLTLILSFKGYSGGGRPFGFEWQLTIQLHDYEYSIQIQGNQVHNAIYSEPLTVDKADQIVGDFLKRFLHQIKQQAQQ